MAAIQELGKLEYDVRAAGGSDGVTGPAIWSVSGFGMANMVRCKADGSGWSGEDQAAIDSWADPAAHTERKFQYEKPLAHRARQELEAKGYIVQRPNATEDVFTVRAERYRRDGLTPDDLPIVGATLRQALRRDYRRELSLPAVDLDDWELFEKVDDLFRPHSVPEDELRWYGHDRRGSYEAGDLAQFRAEVEDREDRVDTVVVQMVASEPQGSTRQLRIQLTARFSTATLWSGDEILVGGVADRLEQLFEAAQLRRQERRTRPPQSRPLEVRVVPDKVSRFRAILNHPWAIGIGAGVFAAIVGVLLSIWLT